MTKGKRNDIMSKLSARETAFEDELLIENWTTTNVQKTPKNSFEFTKSSFKVTEQDHSKWYKPETVDIQYFREFDPGSGWTLAACITHSSRTDWFGSLLPMKVSGGRVSNAWATCRTEGDNTGKLVLIPHETVIPHEIAVKEKSLYDGLAYD